MATAPAVAIKTVKAMRVMCPYCGIGFANIVSEHVKSETKAHGMKDAHKCNSPLCGKYFFIKPRVQIIGVKLEDLQNG